MSRYIDFYLIGELVDSHGNIHYEDLKNLPTADVRENIKGEWLLMESIYDDCTWICSVCGEPFILIAGEPDQNNYNFCPNCGADMRGEEDGNSDI